MTQTSIPIEKGTIQETMLGPLWARAKYSQLYPELLNDTKAIHLIEKLNYNFSEIQQYLGEWRGLGLMARARNFDNSLKRFIETHPESTIVNIGAGLDTTFYRVDNGKIRWYDLDLPDAIQFRKELLSEPDRCKYIPSSAFNYTWFDEIEFQPEKGIFFLLGGFIYYFKEAKISLLFNTMAERFPEGELIFDCISKLAVKIGNRRFKKAGTKEPPWHLSIGNPEKQIKNWSIKIQMVDWFTNWARLSINPTWDTKILKMIKVSERLKIAKIVHIRFLK